ncbi:ABC transporter permease [Candidatus Omnitrophota bacterium]
MAGQKIRKIIELKDLKKTYRIGKIESAVLKGISLEISEGEFVAIMGPSGSGKTTLLNIIGCLDKPSDGVYRLDGVSVNTLKGKETSQIRNRKIGFVFQNYNLLPRLSALKNVELPMIYGDIKERTKRATQALSILGLKERLCNKPTELSGGQQQRVAIARALVNNPGIIVADEPTGNLDSSTGKEIMQILENLNRKGITIILVTHDSNVAKYTKRIINLEDGRIVNDVLNKIVMKPEEEKGAIGFLAKPRFKSTAFSLAKVRENIGMGIIGILAGKARSCLTMLGIAIGVASIISVIAIGQGAKHNFLRRIRSLGTNACMILLKSDSKYRLSNSDIELLQNIPEIVKIAPKYDENSIDVKYGNKHCNAYINATVPESQEVINFFAARGRFITEDDLKYSRKVAVLGNNVVKELFGDEDPIGKDIKIKNIKFNVVGVMEEKGADDFLERDGNVFIPLTTGQRRVFGDRYIKKITVKIATDKAVPIAKKKIKEVLRKRHNLRPGQKDDFRLFDSSVYISFAKQAGGTFTLLLSLVAAINLLVGGIGIMNIMLVSVAERTREIGLRKAIGAMNRDIITQFITETVVLSIAGGMVGIAVGIVASHFIGLKTDWITLVTLDSLILAISFAFVIGILSGLYPAYKAANLKPVEALRYE